MDYKILAENILDGIGGARTSQYFYTLRNKAQI